jgi:hypothetical protein
LLLFEYFADTTNEKVNTTEILAPIAGICINLYSGEQRDLFLKCLSKSPGLVLDTIMFLVTQYKWGKFI